MKSVILHLLAAKAEICYDPKLTDPSRISYAVADLGFPSEIMDDTNSGRVRVQVRLLIFGGKYQN